SDAMQYTLPLKQKQIEQTKLEAQARKEATLQNAEAAAQAKIIDSKAELERQKNLSDAEANRIRVTAAADAERMKFEATVLKQNPMLIQKIIAERLSDKLQIMMVPMDGKNFFASDVLRSAFAGGNGKDNGGVNAAPGTDDDSDDPAPVATATAQHQRKALVTKWAFAPFASAGFLAEAPEDTLFRSPQQRTRKRKFAPSQIAF